jgi:signal transduction histidine kinase
MSINPSLRLTGLPVLLAIGFGILVAISVGTLWLVNEAEDSAGWVAHTFEVDGSLQSLLRFIRRAESGERGYIITGDADDLDIYRTGVEGSEKALADVRRLTADNPAQQAELDTIEPLLRGRLADMANAIAGTQDRTRIVGIIARGRPIMADLNTRLERMRTNEQRLLAERSANFRQASERLLFTTIAGTLLIVILATVSVLQVRRTTKNLQDARQALADTNAGLEATVAERTAELVESNEEIQRYGYIVSHDLRAPLVNIMGFTSELETLKDELIAAGTKPEDDPTRQRAERDFDESIGFIKAGIAKMDALIGAILKISREGRRNFRPERLDMTRLVQGLADAQRHQIDAAGAKVVIDRLPPVTADRLAIEQIFGNLIDNAIKYLDPARPGHVEVTGIETGPRIRYEVRDNGRGIPAKDHGRVFELFRRSGAQDRPGEGIGLAHVKTLVRSLGGRIDLTSEPGKGTTFIVGLPKVAIARQVDARMEQ